jgi:hypothetical protein
VHEETGEIRRKGAREFGVGRNFPQAPRGFTQPGAAAGETGYLSWMMPRLRALGRRIITVSFSTVSTLAPMDASRQVSDVYAVEEGSVAGPLGLLPHGLGSGDPEDCCWLVGVAEPFAYRVPVGPNPVI